MALASVSFVREHLRAPLTLALLILIPALFVVASAAVLGEFASALGGAVAGASASALGAGWAAAFLAGALGFFQASSSRPVCMPFRHWPVKQVRCNSVEGSLSCLDCVRASLQ